MSSMEKKPQGPYQADIQRERGGPETISERESELRKILSDGVRPVRNPGYYPGAGEYHPSRVLAGRVANS